MKKLLMGFRCWMMIICCTGIITAQTSHFSFTSNTGNNMILLIRTSINPEINGEELEIGDEIGVFNVEDLCVGAVVWGDSNITITVWGDDEQTDETDGLKSGDTLRIRLWDNSESEEIAATFTLQSSNSITYSADRISIAETLEANKTRNRRVFEKYAVSGMNSESVTVYDIKGRTVAQSEKLFEKTGINCRQKLTNGAFVYAQYRSGHKNAFLRANIR